MGERQLEFGGGFDRSEAVKARTKERGITHFDRFRAYVKNGWARALRPIDRKVWEVYEQHAGPDGWSRPSRKTVAALIGHTHLGHVRNALRRLESLGLLVRQPGPGIRRGQVQMLMPGTVPARLGGAFLIDHTITPNGIAKSAPLRSAESAPLRSAESAPLRSAESAPLRSAFGGAYISSAEQTIEQTSSSNVGDAQLTPESDDDVLNFGRGEDGGNEAGRLLTAEGFPAGDRIRASRTATVERVGIAIANADALQASGKLRNRRAYIVAAITEGHARIKPVGTADERIQRVRSLAAAMKGKIA